MRRIGKIHARKAFRSDRDGANRDIIGASLQPRQQVAHLRDGHQLVPLVQMLGDTAPQVDAGTDERPAATLPAVRRDLIDADTQRALEARFRSYGRVSKYKDKQRAETGAPRQGNAQVCDHWRAGRVPYDTISVAALLHLASRA
jgi:hypothetical protein